MPIDVSLDGYLNGSTYEFKSSDEFGGFRVTSELIEERAARMSMNAGMFIGNHMEVGTISEYPENDLADFYDQCELYFQSMHDEDKISEGELNLLQCKNDWNIADNGGRSDKKIYLGPRKDGK